MAREVQRLKILWLLLPRRGRNTTAIQMLIIEVMPRKMEVSVNRKKKRGLKSKTRCKCVLK